MRWSRNRKNGAPRSAITTPTGNVADQPRDEVGGGQQGGADDGRDRQHPSRRRADHQPDDVRHDEPDEPDQPADRDAGRRRQGGQGQQDAPFAPDVDAQVARRRIAEEQAVEGPRSQHHEDAGSDDQRRRDREAGPRRTREPTEQEREDLAQVGTRDVHGHRQERRQHGPDGVAGEQEAGQPTGATGTTEPEDDVGGQQRSGEGEGVQEAELDDHDLDRDQDRDRRPERRARRGAQHVRVGQRVAEQSLERRARDGQPDPMTIAVSTRGRRRSQMIVSLAALQSRPIRTPSVRHRITPIVSLGTDLDGPEAHAKDDRDQEDDQSDRGRRPRADLGPRRRRRRSPGRVRVRRQPCPLRRGREGDVRPDGRSPGCAVPAAAAVPVG